MTLFLFSFSFFLFLFPREKLVAHRPEEAFHFSFGRAIAHGRVMEEAADPGADLDNLLRGIDGTIVDVERCWHAAFVEGGAEGEEIKEAR